MCRRDQQLIVKIAAKGTDPAGLVRYLAGPGKGNEHTNQRCIGGTVEYPGRLDAEMATQIAYDLRMPSELNSDVQIPGGNIYHVVLSIKADEGPLTDGRWRALAEDYMKEMGFVDPAKAEVRWTAVNHGLSANGHDHVHIVANLVRMDGTKVSTWQDMPRSQKVATVLEQRHGLRVIQSRLSNPGASSLPFTAIEAGKAKRLGQPIERQELERRIRAAATSAATEADFVRNARADGLLIRPYPATGEVTGYSAGIPAPPDQPQVFFQGGKIARDLSLPRLRGSWPDGGGSAAMAAVEWRLGAPGAPARPGPATPPAPPTVATAEQELQALGERLLSPDPVEFASASHDLAGVLAAGSRVVEGDQIGPIGAASRDVGAWSQTRRALPRTARKRAVGRGTALLLMQALDPTGPMGQAVMYRQLIDAAMALYQLHRARRPVAVRQGRGTRMSGDDGFDDAVESFGTVGITLAARGVQQWAENRREQEADEGFDAVEDRSYREHLRAGNVPAVSASEWAGMDDAQRAQVTPPPADRPQKSPLDWKDAAAPVTGPQRYTLVKAGLTEVEIDQLDKGHASLVIDAIPDGPAKMRAVYDNNTAGALIMGSQSVPVAAGAAGPKQPVQSTPPPAVRNPRRL